MIENNEAKWYESFDYVMAKRKTYKTFSRSNTFLFMFMLIMFSLMVLAIATTTGKYENIKITLAFVLVSTFIIAYPVMWLMSFFPQRVYITGVGIITGKFPIKFEEIEKATVGTIQYDEKDFYVFSFITKKNVMHTYGLSKKINPHELLELLKRYNLNVVE